MSLLTAAESPSVPPDRSTPHLADTPGARTVGHSPQVMEWLLTPETKLRKTLSKAAEHIKSKLPGRPTVLTHVEQK